MKKLTAWLTAIITALGLGLLASGSASAASYCGLAWSSLAKSNQAMSAASVINIRSGQHLCFDRLVIDINGKAAGYNSATSQRLYRTGPDSPST